MNLDDRLSIPFMSDRILEATQDKPVLEIFQHAFRSSKCPHSWIISGKPGIGKTELAHDIAYFVLSNGKSNNASSHSSNAQRDDPLYNQIIDGAHPDMISLKREINAKTGKLKQDIGVSEARSVGAFFSRHASGDGWRICVIDKSDDLNRAASNALLKIVEEPPEKSLILFVANSASQILPTLRSRCRLLKCASLSEADISAFLQEQDQTIPLQELGLISILSDGSMAKAIDLKQGGLDIYREMLACLETLPGAEWNAINKFIASLSGAPNRDRFFFFSYEFIDFLHRLIANTASSNWPDALEREKQLSKRWNLVSKLEHFAEMTSQFETALQQKEEYNLDPSLTLTQLFQKLRQEAG